VFEEKRSVDGTEMTLETHRFALFDRSGEPNGVCAITDDVTDCREAMRLLEQARTAAQEPGRAEGERTGAARPQPSGADDAGLLAELDADLAALTPVRRSSLVRFCEEYRAFSADLATTEDANDPAARRLAHTLKGSAANLRLDEIADTARTLERALRDGETPDTLRTLAARIDRQVAQLDASLQASSPPKTRRLSVPEAPSLTTERADEIRGLAKRLADLLALGDADALATSATLTEAIGTDSDLGLQLEAVGAKVQLFEFQRAQEQLQALAPRIERLGSPQSDATIPEEIGALAAQLGPLLDADDTAAEEVAGRLQRAVMLAPAASSLLPLAERISNAVDRFDYTAASAGLSEMERLRRELATESPVKPGPAPLTHGDEQ
jgi:HPt (histidine-containing phosphotransfer) domain-containing protein